MDRSREISGGNKSDRSREIIGGNKSDRSREIIAGNKIDRSGQKKCMQKGDSKSTPALQ